jgi:hypothetical protein
MLPKASLVFTKNGWMTIDDLVIISCQYSVKSIMDEMAMGAEM